MKGIEVFEFGKWYDHAAEIIGTGIPLFVRQETQRIFSDYQPYIIDKRGLNISIDLMRRQILANIEEDLTLDDDVLLLRKRQKAEMKKFDFKRLPDLDNDKYSLTDSCYFEYTIFNLIHIYKTVDWDKNRLIFIGY